MSVDEATDQLLKSIDVFIIENKKIAVRNAIAPALRVARSRICPSEIRSLLIAQVVLDACSFMAQGRLRSNHDDLRYLRKVLANQSWIAGDLKDSCLFKLSIIAKWNGRKKFRESLLQKMARHRRGFIRRSRVLSRCLRGRSQLSVF